MFFVAGITGHVGGAVAQRLLDRGQQVRTLAREPGKAAEWQRKGVEVREGNLTDAAAVAAALEGVEGAFIMQPTPMAVAPDFPEAKALIAGLVSALRQCPPPRVAVLSSVGSEQTTGIGNITQTHLLENELDDVQGNVAIVRAGGFIENNLPAFKRAGETGFLDSFLQPTDRAVPMVATTDIGREIGDLLVAGWHGRTIIELGSRITPDALAAAASEVLGRPVIARAIPRDQWDARLEAMGLPAAKTGPWKDMQDGFNSGWIDFGVSGTTPIAGSTTPAQVFAAAQAT